jgi:hypothetical protein
VSVERRVSPLALRLEQWMRWARLPEQAPPLVQAWISPPGQERKWPREPQQTLLREQESEQAPPRRFQQREQTYLRQPLFWTWKISWWWRP